MDANTASATQSPTLALINPWSVSAPRKPAASSWASAGTPVRASRTAAEAVGQDQDLADWFTECGYTHLRQLPTGELAGVMCYLFTGGLVLGLTGAGYRTRYCYPTIEDAQQQLAAWDGQGDPAGGWIKRKGDREYLNPAITA